MKRIKQKKTDEAADAPKTGELKSSQLKKIRGGYMGAYQGCDFPDTSTASWGGGGGYGGGWGGGYGGGWW